MLLKLGLSEVVLDFGQFQWIYIYKSDEAEKILDTFNYLVRYINVITKL